ncbi:MAG: phosphate ABC transporter substrate-binding/OmpA family protein, partial [bacterium]
TGDAFQAAAAFNADKKIAACVSWAPDIYNLADVKGNKLLVSSATANKLIADVWFARADFANDHPAIIEGLVSGIFDGIEAMQSPDGKAKAAQLLSEAYSLPLTEATGMMVDAHNTNFAENREFFLNANNPTNFERTWNTAYFLYKRIGSVQSKIAFDQVMDFTYIKKLNANPKYANQTSDYGITFAPQSVDVIQAEDPILVKTVTIHFYPNSWDLNKKLSKTTNGKTYDELYDPSIPAIIEEVGTLAGQYGAARIVIEGHTDSSLKGRVDASLVNELSQNRANSVKEAIVKKFPGLQANQFSVIGKGWDVPADPDDPLNQARNRRVEIKVYPAEMPE